MNQIHSKYKDKFNNTLTIYYQEYDVENPRNWDNIGLFLFPNDSKYLHWEIDCLTYDWDNLIIDDETDDMTEKEILDKYLKDNYASIYPLYKYEHSGILLSLSPFSCSWDSGQIGWYVVTKETFNNYKENYNDLDEDSNLRDMCENEIKTFNQYLSGEVYWYKYNGQEDIKHIDNLVTSVYGNVTELHDPEDCVGYDWYDLEEIVKQFEGMEEVNDYEHTMKIN